MAPDPTEYEMGHENHVVVGASLSGLRAVEAMREHGFDGEITLIGAERELPYYRPPLSKGFLSNGPIPFEELQIQPASFFEENRIALRLGRRAVRLHLGAREVELDSGERLRFHHALIATGAEPRRLNVPGHDLPGVLSLRTFRDATELAKRMERSAHVVVVGAGLIGLEVASAARAAGRRVTVIEAGRAPLRRVLGAPPGALLGEVHRDHGVELCLGATVARIRGSAAAEEVVLTDGRTLPADLVVVGIGVVPATDWLLGSGLQLDNGILADELGRTNVPGVYAAGDVARSYNPRLGAHVRLEQTGNAHHQGMSAGRAMVGGAGAPSAYLPACASEQFGLRLQMVGHLQGDEDVVLRGRKEDGAFMAFYLREGAVVGAFAMNRPRELLAARKLILARARVSPDRLADTQLPVAEPA